MRSALAATLIIITGVIQGVLGAAQRVRTLVQNDRPIVSRLLPDDQVVIVRRLSGPGLPPPPGTPTPETALKQLARWEEIAVIQHPKPQSFFVMNGTWLNTRVRARVVQSLKTSRLSTAPGKSIEFEFEGGELEVKGVNIRSSGGILFEDKNTYLVALRFDNYRKRWEPVSMFLLDHLGVLGPFRGPDGSTSSSHLHGLSLAAVTDAIANSAK